LETEKKKRKNSRRTVIDETSQQSGGKDVVGQGETKKQTNRQKIPWGAREKDPGTNLRGKEAQSEKSNLKKNIGGKKGVGKRVGTNEVDLQDGIQTP